MTTESTPQQLPRRCQSGMRTRAVNAAAGVIQAAMEQGRQLPVSLAIALDSAQLLNSPEHAAEIASPEAEVEQWRATFGRDSLPSAPARMERAEARVAELEAEREKLVRWHGEDSKAITTLIEQRDRRQTELVALRNDALAMRGSLAPADGARKVPFELGETLTPAMDWLIGRVAELEARLTEYERPADEDPITFALTPKAEAAVDRLTRMPAPTQAVRERADQ